jgi:hypothetical protein
VPVGLYPHHLPPLAVVKTKAKAPKKVLMKDEKGLEAAK